MEPQRRQRTLPGAAIIRIILQKGIVRALARTIPNVSATTDDTFVFVASDTTAGACSAETLAAETAALGRYRPQKTSTVRAWTTARCHEPFTSPVSASAPERPTTRY